MALPSPKRKRGQDTIPRLQPVSLRPSLGDSEDDNSPRTSVAGRFKQLDLQSPAPLNHGVEEPSSKRIALNHRTFSDDKEDPTLHLSTKPPPNSGPQAMQPPPSSLFTFSNLTTSEPLQHTATMARPGSPPLESLPSELYWSDCEITGHDPNDPEDDLYGINGIGFKATPAVAWARSQRRKQQLADYKNREAREARQRRIERRKVGGGDATAVLASADTSANKEPRVRFEHG